MSWNELMIAILAKLYYLGYDVMFTEFHTIKNNFIEY